MEEERDDVDNCMLELVDVISEDRQVSKMRQILENGNHRTRDTRET